MFNVATRTKISKGIRMLLVLPQEAAAFEKENAELKLKVKSLEKQCCLYEKAQTETQSGET